MGKPLRTATGVREVTPGVFELRASLGRDPLTGKYSEITRRFEGTLRKAKTARAELVAEVQHGRHKGTNATVDELVPEWLRELERKQRSPRTIGEYERRYRHDIQPALGTTPVRKVTTKMLTDLYGAHQRRGQSAASIRKIHATISSMMSQACRWGWRDSNPATWAETPPIEVAVPIVPTPDEVRLLIDAASKSKRPEHADVIYLAATTGARRGEICALRPSRIDWEASTLVISRNIIRKNGQRIDRPTKNRRRRLVAIDDRCVRILRCLIDANERRASDAGVSMVDDPYILTTTLNGSDPWDPDTISQYFGRLRARVGLDHLEFKSLRRFMDTYGQELGFSLAQVAMRAGHDPAVASRHYTGRVTEVDRRLAAAMSELLQAPRQ